MTTALPFPLLPGVPGGGASPPNPGAKTAAPKVTAQRDFSPVLDDARAVVDRQQAPADQARPRQDVGRRDHDNDSRDDQQLDSRDPGKPDPAGPTADKSSPRPTDDESTSTSFGNEQPNSDAADRELGNEAAAEDLEGVGEEATNETEQQGTTRTLAPAQPEPHATALTSPAAPATDNADGEPASETSIELSTPSGGHDADASGSDLTGQVDIDVPTPDHGAQPTGHIANGADTSAVTSTDPPATSVRSAEAIAIASDETMLPSQRHADASDSPIRDGIPLTDELQPATWETPATPGLDSAATNETAVTAAAAPADSPTELVSGTDGPETTPTAPQATSRTEGPVSGNSAPSPNTTAAVPDIRTAATPETTTARFEVAAASASTPDLATDETQDELWGQVQRALTRVRSGAEGQELRMRLRPAELGELLVQVRATGDQLAVRLVTTSGAAHQALLNDQPRLAAELRHAGFDGSSVDISQQNQQQGDPNQRSRGESGSANRSPNASPSSVFASADGQPVDRRQTVSVQRPRGGLVDITL